MMVMHRLEMGGLSETALSQILISENDRIAQEVHIRENHAQELEKIYPHPGTP
jgi:hypothetical protein